MDKRVRTGCGTCRRRRVKCDEAKPICNRCRTANFECEGYAVPRRAKTHSASGSDLGRSPPHSSKPPQMVSELAWRHQNWRQEQLPLYHHFVTTTVVRLFRNDHVIFWRDQVAQMSYSVDLVYEALLAIGAVHRSQLLTCQEGTEQEAARFKILGLRSYGKTITMLHSYLGQTTIPEVLSALVTLMLLAYFECFMENPKGAFRHLWAAIQLFRNSQDRMAEHEISNMVPVFDAMLRLDFLAQKIVPYAKSSFLMCSDQAIMESPFWNRPAPEFPGVTHLDRISAERFSLIRLVCAHNKLSKVVWGCWYPTSERPTRGELMGFYSEMLLWKNTSPATFEGAESLDGLEVREAADVPELPMPPPPYFFKSNEAALNAAMFNGYMGCGVAMINTTDPDPDARELEAFNLVYKNLCIARGLVERHTEEAVSPYKPCDAISMGISTYLFHGARRCFSLAWQKWTATALRQIGREGLSNGRTLANTVEIMYGLEAKLNGYDINKMTYSETNTYLGPIRDRLIPLLMPRGDEDQHLAFYLRYGESEDAMDERDEALVQIMAKATWTEDPAGVITSLKIDEYATALGGNTRPSDRPDVLEIFAGWRRAVEEGWHGYLSKEIQDGFIRDGLTPP